MSTRFPALSSPVPEGTRFSTTPHRFFIVKPWIVDAVFVGMVLVSVVGLAYALLR
jgi:hypothetical protein